MKRLTAGPDKDVDKVKLRSAFRGEGAYEAFKRIASEFYKDHTYKFVALTLIGCPQLDSVEFEAEFWSMPSEAAAPPPNAPLTLEELREMDGEPVWSEYYQTWGLISVEAGGKWRSVPFFLFTEDGIRREKNIEQRRLTLYRRKPEGGESVGN